MNSNFKEAGKSWLRRMAIVAGAVLCLGVGGAVVAPAASAEKVSDCNFNLDWPHKSTHNKANVDSSGVIDCRSTKKSMEILVGLTYAQPDAHPVTAHQKVEGKRFLKVTAATRCAGGMWRATATFVMYELNGKKVGRNHETPWQSVRC